MKFGFIFVLFNTTESEKKRLIKEVENLKLKSFEICMIDNTNTGYGYSKGVNLGISKLKSSNIDIFVVGNTDISISSLNSHQIYNLVKKYDVSSFSMIQNKNTYYCGKLDKKRLTSYIETKKPQKKYIECEYITGSLLFIDKKVINQIGMFNDDYFMYYEDVDFCARAIDAGYNVGIDTSIAYKHYEISKKNRMKDVLIFQSWVKFFLSRASFHQKLMEVFRLPKTLIQNKKTIVYLLYQHMFKRFT